MSRQINISTFCIQYIQVKHLLIWIVIQQANSFIDNYKILAYQSKSKYPTPTLTNLKMISCKILSLTNDQKLIVKLSESQIKLVTIEGFIISQKIMHRHYFSELINKEIKITYNKNKGQIKYQNDELIVKLLKVNALRINKQVLLESKLYSQKQKQMFLGASSQSIQSNQKSEIKQEHNLNDQQKVIVKNLVENSKQLKNIFKQKQKINVNIEYLSQYILFRHQDKSTTQPHTNNIIYFQGRMHNLKAYFELFSQQVFWKSFVSLQQSIQIQILTCKFDLIKKKYYAQIEFPECKEKQLLSNGWAVINNSNLDIFQKRKFQKFNQIQQEAKQPQNHKGIFGGKSQILNFIYAKNNFVGIVTDIIEGYIFEITTLKNSQIHKIQLPSIICPIAQEPGSFQCRQFARKNLIGQQVNVYLQKDQGLNMNGSIIRSIDWKDIECLMLQNGMAFVRQDIKQSILGYKYIEIEKKAKDKQKGLHRKQLGNKRYQNLTLPPTNKYNLKQYIERRYEILSHLQIEQQGVIEEISSVTNYKVRIQTKSKKFKIILNLSLENVIEPQMNPNIQEFKIIKQEAKKFQKKNFTKRNVIVSISEYDEESNHFIGTIRINQNSKNKNMNLNNKLSNFTPNQTQNLIKKDSRIFKEDFQQILLSHSFVYADKYNSIAKYLTLEQQTKKQKKHIWQQKLLCFEPVNQLDKQLYCFEGTFSWIQNGRDVCIHPKTRAEKLKYIESVIQKQKLQQLSKQHLRIGAWCIAPYLGQMYRAVIKQHVPKAKKYIVQFMDWGNKQYLKKEQLMQMPKELLFIEQQCIHAEMHLVKKSKNKQSIEKIRQFLLESGQSYIFKKVHSNLVNVYDGETLLNTELIMKGLIKSDYYELSEMKDKEEKQVIQIAEEQLRKERIGIWQFSDVEEDEEYLKDQINKIQNDFVD